MRDILSLLIRVIPRADITWLACPGCSRCLAWRRVMRYRDELYCRNCAEF